MSSAYPKELKTLRDYVRPRRLDDGLFQKDAARILGADATTAHNWEQNHASPNLRAIPNIIEFLGDNPFPEPHTIGETLRYRCWGLGLSCAQAPQLIGVDPGILSADLGRLYVKTCNSTVAIAV